MSLCLLPARWKRRRERRADAILDCSARGEIVLDAFLGSGTTLIAFCAGPPLGGVRLRGSRPPPGGGAGHPCRLMMRERSGWRELDSNRCVADRAPVHETRCHDYSGVFRGGHIGSVVNRPIHPVRFGGSAGAGRVRIQT
jgi:hypothetical protein